MRRTTLCGFSVLDNEQDKAGVRNSRRWRIFRSTVAFALQETFPLNHLTVLWQPSLKGHAEFLERTLKDIQTKIAQRGRKLDIKAVPVEFHDPFDLQECFRVFWETLLDAKREETQVFFNLNNGTHTMQMAVFLLARYQPKGEVVHLLQTFRDRSIEDPLFANNFFAKARRIDLKWENLKPLEQEIRKEKEEIFHSISLKNSNHSETKKLFEEIVDIGCYTDDPILLTGPTGSGKSRIAQEIHLGWERRKSNPPRPFYEINAAGLSGDLLRSALFGHLKGSFTGAHQDQDGFLTASNHGTFFLDEIGELDLRSQAELLLAIETKTFFPVGSTRRKTSNFRLVCATNKDLRKMVQEGSFREDLYTRIRCWEFKLPGLRDLPKDFEESVDYEIKLCNSEEFQKGNENPFQVSFDQKAKESFISFGLSEKASWTGNFRDLKFSIRRMKIKAKLKECPISPEIVEEEIARLASLWGEPYSENHDHDLKIVIYNLENIARKRFPNKNLLDGIEGLLLEEAFFDGKNKAQVAKWLYETPGKPLANPSNRFRERFKSLFG